MIHPNTTIKIISETVGYGVFATADIPEGSIVYVKDSLEQVVTPEAYLMQSKEMKNVVDKYSYMDQNGDRIISWDFAKYVNHCCNCNTISTGYGFEIAIRDIQEGEQITDEYGIFNLDEEMNLECGFASCRKRIAPSDFDMYYQEWDEKIKKSIPKLFQVPQPLLSFIDDFTQRELAILEKQPELYRSVYALKHIKKEV